MGPDQQDPRDMSSASRGLKIDFSTHGCRALCGAGPATPLATVWCCGPASRSAEAERRPEAELLGSHV
eukprot:2042752-Prymnesium_polylepis.2